MKKFINKIYKWKTYLSERIAYYDKDKQDHAIISLAVVWSSLFIVATYGLKTAFWYMMGWTVVFIINEVIDYFSDNGNASIKDFFVSMVVIIPITMIYLVYGFNLTT